MLVRLVSVVVVVPNLVFVQKEVDSTSLRLRRRDCLEAVVPNWWLGSVAPRHLSVEPGQLAEVLQELVAAVEVVVEMHQVDPRRRLVLAGPTRLWPAPVELVMVAHLVLAHCPKLRFRLVADCLEEMEVDPTPRS